MQQILLTVEITKFVNILTFQKKKRNFLTDKISQELPYL